MRGNGYYGNYGFFLPPQWIIPNAEEIVESLIAMVHKSREYGYLEISPAPGNWMNFWWSQKTNEVNKTLSYEKAQQKFIVNSSFQIKVFFRRLFILTRLLTSVASRKWVDWNFKSLGNPITYHFYQLWVSTQHMSQKHLEVSLFFALNGINPLDGFICCDDF